MPDRDTKELLVTLPLSLHTALKVRARRDERSIAATIRFAIRLYLRRPVDA